MGSWKKHLKRVYEGIISDRRQLLEEGLAKGFQDDYEGAIEDFDRVIYLTNALVNDDEKKVAYFYKAIALSELGKQDEAITTFKEYLEMDEDDEDGWNGLGAEYMEKEQFEKALECFDKSIKINPKESIFWLNKSEALLELEQFEKALECVNEGLKLEPKNNEGVLIKCDILNSCDKSEEVIELLENIEYNDEFLSEIEYVRGVAYYELDKIEKALECVEKAIQNESPDDNSVWYNKACYLSRLDRKDDALDALIVATSLEPENLIEMRDEDDFVNIRETPRFKRLLNQPV